MRIDAHQHFWRYSPQAHPWIDDTMLPLRQDFLPPQLAAAMLAAGVTGCVAVQAQARWEETLWLLQLAEENSFIRGVVGWVDLRASDLPLQLERLARQGRLKGLRQGAQDEPDDFLLHPAFRRGMANLARLGLTFDLLVRPRQLPAAVALVSLFPEQQFILDHLGKPDVRQQVWQPWASHLADLARRPNVAAKLSGLLTEADWKGWQPGHLTPYLDHALDCFGADRLLMASDWPVCTLAASYPQAWAAVANHLARLSDDEQGAVLGGTAKRIYGL